MLWYNVDNDTKCSKDVRDMAATIVVKGDPISEVEQQEYLAYLEQKYGCKVEYLELQVDGEEVDLHYRFAQVPIQRIRRITGYLVGTMDRWNGAKRAEEADRVKHQLS